MAFACIALPFRLSQAFVVHEDDVLVNYTFQKHESNMAQALQAIILNVKGEDWETKHVIEDRKRRHFIGEEK